MNKNHYINAYRTPAQRRARYCFLRHMGLNRNCTRAIVGRSDAKIVQSLETLSKVL